MNLNDLITPEVQKIIVGIAIFLGSIWKIFSDKKLNKKSNDISVKISEIDTAQNDRLTCLENKSKENEKINSQIIEKLNKYEKNLDELPFISQKIAERSFLNELDSEFRKIIRLNVIDNQILGMIIKKFMINYLTAIGNLINQDLKKINFYEQKEDLILTLKISDSQFDFKKLKLNKSFLESIEEQIFDAEIKSMVHILEKKQMEHSNGKLREAFKLVVIEYFNIIIIKISKLYDKQILTKQ